MHLDWETLHTISSALSGFTVSPKHLWGLIAARLPAEYTHVCRALFSLHMCRALYITNISPALWQNTSSIPQLCFCEAGGVSKQTNASMKTSFFCQLCVTPLLLNGLFALKALCQCNIDGVSRQQKNETSLYFIHQPPHAVWMLTFSNLCE